MSGAASETWLVGGGEMGALIRSLDWSRSPVGPIDAWPQSLRTALGICLSSRFPMAIWWGPDIVQFYNDGYRPFLGDKHPRSMGQRGDECWAEIWDVCGPLYRQVMTTGESTWSADLQLLMDRTGYVEETYFTFSYSPIRGERVDVLGNLITVTETTERVIGERRLRTLRDISALAMAGATPEEAARLALQTLADNTADVPFARLYLVDDERHPRLVHARGVTPGDPVSGAWPVAHVLATGHTLVVDDLRAMGPLPCGAWSDPAHTALLLPLVSGDVVIGVLVAAVSPRRRLDDSYRGFYNVLASQIATALTNARAHDEQRKRAETLAALDRAKTEFFSNVSHEFRTPLTLMLGPLDDALRSDALPAAEREQLLIAQRNSLRLLKLVNTLLDFSRLEAGRAEAVYEPLDIAAATADLAATFRSAIERAGLRLVVDCPPLPEPVWVDREMWEKVVLNLLSNAFKFTFEGEIAVRLRTDAEHVVVEVADTGIGIGPDDLSHVFERFHRVRGARARTHEGTGIGLTLVRQLVELHGGTIRVTSRLDAGSTFTIRIPRGAAHLPPDRVGAARTRASTALSATAFVDEAARWLPESAALDGPAPAAIETAGARVLLVDDNADMRDYLKRLLAPYWTVDVAGDGAEALDKARAEPPDLVLSDVMMPRLDGHGLLKALRENARTAVTPVILLSARAGEDARVEGLATGADDYLVKPFAARELIARVNAHLRLARARLSTQQELERQYSAADAARRTAEAASRAKDEFLAMLAHELRNPLGVVLNGVKILDRIGSGDDEAARIRSVITRQMEHLSRLLDDLLDVARISQGRIELRKEPVDLRTVVDFAVESERHRIVAKAQTLDVVMPSAPIMVYADRARLQQVVGNLIHNASKYTPEHGRVGVSVGHAGDEASVRVRDTGVGIPPEKLAAIFELFVQLDTSPDRAEGGLGIGLTLVRRLLEQHAGHVRAESAGLGLGSEFIVTLPTTAAAQPAAPVAPASSVRPLRILLIEDNADARDMLELGLTLAGHDVESAANGPGGIDAAIANHPDVAIVDLGLPEMDGLEVARVLRAKLGSRIRLIALTGYGQPADRERTRAAGFDAHVTKPASVEDLLAALPA